MDVEEFRDPADERFGRIRHVRNIDGVSLRCSLTKRQNDVIQFLLFGMSEKEILALERIPIRYCKQNTSNLQFDVVSGNNSFELKMTSK